MLNNYEIEYIVSLLEAERSSFYAVRIFMTANDAEMNWKRFSSIMNPVVEQVKYINILIHNLYYEENFSADARLYMKNLISSNRALLTQLADIDNEIINGIDRLLIKLG